jgi:hypothetical protein
VLFAPRPDRGTAAKTEPESADLWAGGIVGLAFRSTPQAATRPPTAPVRWRQYLCRVGSAHNSVEAASIAAARLPSRLSPLYRQQRPSPPSARARSGNVS